MSRSAGWVSRSWTRRPTAFSRSPASARARAARGAAFFLRSGRGEPSAILTSAGADLPRSPSEKVRRAAASSRSSGALSLGSAGVMAPGGNSRTTSSSSACATSGAPDQSFQPNVKPSSAGPAMIGLKSFAPETLTAPWTIDEWIRPSEGT